MKPSSYCIAWPLYYCFAEGFLFNTTTDKWAGEGGGGGGEGGGREKGGGGRVEEKKDSLKAFLLAASLRNLRDVLKKSLALVQETNCKKFSNVSLKNQVKDINPTQAQHCPWFFFLDPDWESYNKEI